MLLVVGGHSRNVGKTSVACGIIAATKEACWQAIKITQHGHSVCSENGHPCDCAPTDPAHPFALDEQREADSTDTGRYLAAGAERAFWLRTAQGELGYAVPALKPLLAAARNTVIESNSVLQFFAPDLYLVVLDYAVEDMKDSARLFFDRASVFVVNEGEGLEPPWPGIPKRWLVNKPLFHAHPPRYVSAELADFVRERVATCQALFTKSSGLSL